MSNIWQRENSPNVGIRHAQTQVMDAKILREYASDLYLAADSVGMSEWEKDFAFDMTGKQSFSAAQGRKLLELVEKYDL